MGRKLLGELEHLLLIAVVRLEDRAYGAAIIDEIERRTGRELSHASAYIALQRLEDKALVAGSEGAAAAVRGGRPRRYFTLTDAGRQRLEESSGAVFSMWAGIEAPAGSDTSR